MAQYAVLIYQHDSAHAPDSTPQDRESCDRHSDELDGSGVMVAAYALTPRAMATSVRGDTVTGGPVADSGRSSLAFTSSKRPTWTPPSRSPAPTQRCGTAVPSRSGRCTAHTS